jgi:hypothetical protein
MQAMGRATQGGVCCCDMDCTAAGTVQVRPLPRAWGGRGRGSTQQQPTPLTPPPLA